MDVWRSRKWKKHLQEESIRRVGLRMHYEKGVHPEVRRACDAYVKWLRKHYDFPIRVPVYVKKAKCIRARDGEAVDGTFFGPYNYVEEPYIRLATGLYAEECIRRDKDSALMTILVVLTHELTHYFQWINGQKLTEKGEERQANNYAYKVFWEYADELEHL